MGIMGCTELHVSQHNPGKIQLNTGEHLIHIDSVGDEDFIPVLLPGNQVASDPEMQ